MAIKRAGAAPHDDQHPQSEKGECAPAQRPGGKRKDQGEEGRFRKFTREALAERNDNLDITWLRDENATHSDDLPEPDVIATRITERLRTALAEMEKLNADLEAKGVAS